MPVTGQKRTRAEELHPFGAHPSLLSGFSGPITPATPVSATELPTHAGGVLSVPGANAPKRPRLIETAATNAARGAAGGGHGHGAGATHAHHALDSALAFDMDPCLSPLSPLRLTDPAPRGPVGTASDMQVIFDGLGSEPFSPLLTPRGGSMLSGVLHTPKTPRDAANFAHSALSGSPPRAAQPVAEAAALKAQADAEAAAPAAAPAAAQPEQQEKEPERTEEHVQQSTADADATKPVQHVATGFCEALSPLLPPTDTSAGPFVLSA